MISLPDAGNLLNNPTISLNDIPRELARGEQRQPLLLGMPEIHRMLDDVRRFPRSYFRKLGIMEERVRRFSREVIRPRALDVEQSVFADPNYFPHDIMREACKYGLFSALIPESCGGGGFLSLHMSILAEELAAGCGGLATTIGVHSGALSCGLISVDAGLLATEVRAVVDAEKRGCPILWAGAVTEPAAGTDIWDEQFIHKSAVATRAQKVPGGYMLNGRKCFISNGSIADYTVVAAGTDPHNLAGTWTAFLVPKSAEGFSTGRVEHKMGQKSSPTAELIFEDLFLPESARMGIEGQGGRYVSIYLAGSRGPVGAIGVGCGRRALECLIDWAQHRTLAQKPLLEQQWVQMEIATMARRLQAGRLTCQASALAVDGLFVDLLGKPLVRAALLLLPDVLARSRVGRHFLSAAWIQKMMDNMLSGVVGEQRLRHATALATIAKIEGSNAGVDVSARAVEIMGNDAFDPRWPVDKCFRDARLTQIYEGTNQANAMTQFKATMADWPLQASTTGGRQ